MKWFYDLKVSAKLLLAFGLVALLTGIISYEGISSLQSADNSDTILYTHNTVPLSEMAIVSESFQRGRVNFLEALVAAEIERRDAQLKTMEDRDKDIEKYLASFEKTILTEEGKKSLAELRTAFNDYNTSRDTAIKLLKENKKAEAMDYYIRTFEKLRTNVQNKVQGLLNQKITLAKDRADQNSVDASSAMRTMIILMILGVILAMAFGILIARMISKPLNKGVDFAVAVAAGDLTQRVAIDQKDEVGKLASALNEMVEKLKEIVEGVKAASDNVSL